MVWDIPFLIPLWGTLGWHGLEFVLALFFSLRLLGSEQHKRVGFALLVFLLSPLLQATGDLGYVGPHVIVLADRVVLVFVLLILGTAHLQKKENSDSLSL